MNKEERQRKQLKTIITKIAKMYGYRKHSEEYSPRSQSVYLYYIQPGRNFAVIRFSDHELPYDNNEFTIRFDLQLTEKDIVDIHEFFKQNYDYN